MAPKVILLSLDGAADSIADKYLQTGVLDAKTGLGLLKSKIVNVQLLLTQNLLQLLWGSKPRFFDSFS